MVCLLSYAVVLALGTNALATSVIIKAGANEGASGESAVVYNASRVDVIMGSIAILFAHSMLGELTPLNLPTFYC